MQVRVANGKRLASSQQVKALKWWSQGYTFSTNMRVLQLGAYDAILGYDWLKAHSPVVCHWELKTMEFQEGEQHVHLQGMQLEQGSFDALSPEQFVKSFKGNDIWAIAVVRQVDAIDTDSVPE
jgi:hypothetical protein